MNQHTHQDKHQDNSDTIIALKNLYKVFAADAGKAIRMLEKGANKAEVLDTMNAIVGLDNISLDINRGENFVVMGLSGSGKSTLIRHINRLVDPSQGEVIVDGENILTYTPKQLRAFRRAKVSMVFQSFALLPHKTVLQNIAHPLLIAGAKHKAAYQKAGDQLELVGLEGFADYRPHQLSGGMRQRVGLARALVSEGDILLLDEPFSALDPLIRNDMQNQLKTLQEKLHKTIVFITHDLDEAFNLGDRIAILNEGCLAQCGTPKEILQHPADGYVRRFTNDLNRARVITANSVMQPCEVVADEHTKNDADICVIAEPLHVRRAGEEAYTPAVAIRHDTYLQATIPVFSEDIHNLVVTRAGAIVGVLSREDVLTALMPN